LCVLAYPKILTMNCLSRNIKVEGSKLVNVKHQKSILLERCLCALSIGDFAYILYVHPGQVSKFDISMCCPKLEISYFFTNWESVCYF